MSTDEKNRRTSSRWRKRSVEVEAIRYQPGANCADVGRFVGEMDSFIEADHANCNDKEPFYVLTASGKHVAARAGDWIVKQVLPDGSEDVWPVAAEVFEQTYEPAPVQPLSDSDKEAIDVD